LAEVIKYGLIRDLPFLEWLEVNLDRLLAREPTALAEAIEPFVPQQGRSGRRGRDESGERALLNLGHTFGHAIETGMGYGQWLHGEAVAAGTLMAAELRRSWAGSARTMSSGVALFQRAGLPVYGPCWVEALS
jgi:3-dehydroquinate synthetase